MVNKLATIPEFKGRGRPTKYRAEHAERAFRHCLLGATDEQLAALFNVGVHTIENWKRRHPDFLGAITSGKEDADSRVAEALFRRATGYSHDAVKIFAPKAEGGEPVVVPYTEYYPPDTQAASLWLRNRRPQDWRDKTDVAVSGQINFEALVLAVAARREARKAQTEQEALEQQPGEGDE